MQITNNASVTEQIKLTIKEILESMQLSYPSNEWDNYSVDDVLQAMMYVDIVNLNESWNTIDYEWRSVFSQHFLGLLLGNRMFELSMLVELDFLDVIVQRTVPKHVVITACLEMSTLDCIQRNEGLIKPTTTTFYKGGMYSCLINGDETYIGETDHQTAYGITLLTPEAKFETALEYLASIKPQLHYSYYLRNGKWDTLYLTERLETLIDVDIFVHYGRFNLKEK